MGVQRWSFEILKCGISGVIGATLTFHLFDWHNGNDDKVVQPVQAAESIIVPPRPASPLESTTVNNVGLPLSNQLRVFSSYVCAYDRRNRVPLWVLEHLTPANVGISSNPNEQAVAVDRSQFEFYEDMSEFPIFRASNKDYQKSGYDRGHLAAAGNHRFDKQAMQETFNLCNIAPQVGIGFNRHAWNDLEKYIRGIARRSASVVVITGPLYLPRMYGNKKYVHYEVIGENDVAVPTHFFKAIAIQSKPFGKWECRAWVLPNEKLPEKVDLNSFQVPIGLLERKAGLKLFPNI